jgi:hypothetical protein
MQYTIKKSTDCTKDGAYVYDLSEIPQEGRYIKMRNMFARTEKQVYKQIENILGTKDFTLNIV